MKFKKNDLVSINLKAFCSVFNASCDEASEESVEYHKVLNCRITDTGIEYKLRGCYGWWKEEHLMLKPEPTKNSPSRDETLGPDTLLPKEQNASEGENEAFWIKDYDVGCVVYICSCCKMSALNDWRGRSTDSKFCPSCGKKMINSTMED